jgi:osmotically-inducible protein OsmY
MKQLKSVALATLLAAPAAVFAQTYYVERITVYEHPRYMEFVANEHGALQSGGNNLNDILLADRVAMAIANDPLLDDTTATIVSHNGKVSVSGLGNQQQSYRAQQIARRVAGQGNVSGEMSSDLG